MEDKDEIEFQSTPTIRTVVAQLPDLPAAEQRAAQAISDDPAAVIRQSVGELADRADVSPATVVRLVRRLGFDGFAAFKISLAHEAGRASSFGHPTTDQIDAADSILHAVIRDELDALRYAVESIEQSTFDQAVGLLTGASEIMFVGVGTSAHLSQLAAYRFCALGIAATALGDTLSQHVRIDTLPGDAVIVAISHTGASDDTCLIAEHARSRNLNVIALTSSARSPLAEIAGVVITTGHNINPHRLDNFDGRTVHVAILSALHAAVAINAEQAAEAGVAAAKLVAQHQR